MKKHYNKEKVTPAKSTSAAKKKMKSLDVQLKNPKQIETEKQKKTTHQKIKPVPIQEGDKVSETQRVKRDITKRKSVEAELIIANKELAFENKEKEKRAEEVIIAREKEKRAEEVIRDNEKHFKDLIESLPQLFWTCRVDGHCDYLSKQWVEFTGIQEEDQLGYGWLKQLHPDDKERTVTEWTVKVKAGESFDIEFRIRRADGNYRWFKLRAVPMRDTNNNIIRWFGSNTDFDDLKRSLEAQARLVSIIESSTDMISYADINSNILYINRAGKKILGLNADDDITTFKIEDFIYDDAKDDIFNTTLPEIIKNGSWKGDSEFKDINGKKIPTALTCTLLKNKNGEPEFMAVNARDITERKKVEEALLESEERFRIAAETSNDVVYEWDLKQVVKWFGKIDEMLGYNPGEFPRTLDGLGASVHPDDWIRVMASVQAHLEGRAPYTEEYRVIKKEGTYRWWSARGAVSRTHDGNPSRWVGTVTDITERKLAEEALREIEKKYRTIVDRASDGIMIGQDGTMKFSNAGFAAMLGYEVNEVEGAEFSKTIPPENLGFLLERHQKRLAGEQVSALYETTMLHKNGERIPVEINASIVQYEGKPADLVIMRNITERKQAEETSVRLASLVEASDDAIIGKDFNGIITSWNPGAEKLFGYSANESVGRSILQIVPQDRWNEEEQLLILIRSTGHAHRFETVRLTRDGQLIDVAVTSSPIKDAAGNLVGISKVVRDITERKQAEEEIRQLNADLEHRVVMRTAQLEASNKELEAFTYSVSHDLRAPLRHISGYVQLLTSRFHSTLSDKGQHYLDSIADSVHQMGLLIDNLLQFSRTGRAEMRRIDSDMNGIINEVIESLGKDNPDRSIEWTVAKLPSVFCDSAMMRLVWMNLMSNAVKFTRTREKALIEIGARVEKREVIFFVRDNGVGFDMQYAQKLFGVFQRLHSTVEFEGTGIGLANVQRIIMRHGGRTWAEAELDKGATFYFSI